jgi:hypothetical protein
LGYLAQHRRLGFPPPLLHPTHHRPLRSDRPRHPRRRRRGHSRHGPSRLVCPPHSRGNPPSDSLIDRKRSPGCRPLTAPTGACLPACPLRLAGGRDCREERPHARRRSHHLDQLDRLLRLRRPLCHALGREVNGQLCGRPCNAPAPRIPTLPTAPDARPRVRGLFCAYPRDPRISANIRN